MNIIIRDGGIDRYATNEEFWELHQTIKEDLERLKIYISTCEGNQDTLTELINTTIKSLSKNHGDGSLDLEIALTQENVVFNIFSKKSNSLGLPCEDREIVILNRNMHKVYFINKIGTLSVQTDNQNLIDFTLGNFSANYFSLSNKKIVNRKCEFKEYYRDELEHPFASTDTFVSNLDKILEKSILTSN